MKHVIGYASTAVSSFVAGLLTGTGRFVIGLIFLAFLLKAPLDLLTAYYMKQIELTEKRMTMEHELTLKKMDKYELNYGKYIESIDKLEQALDLNAKPNKEGL